MTISSLRISSGMIVAEACAYYGWTVDHVLTMKASRFFLMFESAKKLKSAELQRLCYVARSAQMVDKAFHETIGYFGSLGGVDEHKPTLPEKPKNAPKPMTVEQQSRVVMAAFAKDARINRAQPVNPRPTKGTHG